MTDGKFPRVFSFFVLVFFLIELPFEKLSSLNTLFLFFLAALGKSLLKTSDLGAGSQSLHNQSNT